MKSPKYIKLSISAEEIDKTGDILKTKISFLAVLDFETDDLNAINAIFCPNQNRLSKIEKSQRTFVADTPKVIKEIDLQ